MKNCDLPAPISGLKVGFAQARTLVIALGAFVILAASAQGQAPIFVSNAAGDAGIQVVTCMENGVAVRNKPCEARIGDGVSLEIRNLAAWLEKLKVDKVITSAESGDELVVEQLPNLRLFIGEHLMRTLLPTQYVKDSPDWYPLDSERKAALARSWLEFNLKREAANKESRADWDQVLRSSGVSPKMPLAVGIYNANRNMAHVLALPAGTVAGPEREFKLLRIAWDEWTIAGMILLALAAGIFIYMSIHTGMVRDSTCPAREDGLPPYSLGRCQMAFWFFLVISAFYFLWVITGRGDTDTINSTVLSLIGISAGTALGSAIVSKNEAATSAAVGNAPRPVFIYPDAIKAAQEALAQAKANRGKRSDLTPVSAKMDDDDIQTRTQEVARLKAEFKQWRAQHRTQLLLDLLSDQGSSAGENRVITFHRFQIVVWTLVLGVIFVSEVLTKLAMPAFDSTLLVLMGISSGTYLGFRVSAKQSD
jgi:hypothetical protein